MAFCLDAWNSDKPLEGIIRIQPCACKTGTVKHNEKGDHY
jgi:hypothetical protein